MVDPQVRRRETVAPLCRPGLGPLPTVGPPVQAAGEPGFRARPAPALGALTEETVPGALAAGGPERPGDLGARRAIA